MNRRHPRKRGTKQKTQIKWGQFWREMANRKTVFVSDAPIKIEPIIDLGEGKEMVAGLPVGDPGEK